MGIRGRPSSAALSVIGPNGLESVKRPTPPPELTKEEVEEWREVVNRLPADWFPRETHALLTQYCRHVVASRRVAEMIAGVQQAMTDANETAGEDGNVLPVLKLVKTIDRLYKMQEREGRAITSLATKMRISQQSQYDKTKKRGKVQTDNPWE